MQLLTLQHTQLTITASSSEILLIMFISHTLLKRSSALFHVVSACAKIKRLKKPAYPLKLLIAC